MKNLTSRFGPMDIGSYLRSTAILALLIGCTSCKDSGSSKSGRSGDMEGIGALADKGLSALPKSQRIGSIVVPASWKIVEADEDVDWIRVELNPKQARAFFQKTFGVAIDGKATFSKAEYEEGAESAYFLGAIKMEDEQGFALISEFESIVRSKWDQRQISSMSIDRGEHWLGLRAGDWESFHLLYNEETGRLSYEWKYDEVG